MSALVGVDGVDYIGMLNLTKLVINLLIVFDFRDLQLLNGL